eukprot:403359327
MFEQNEKSFATTTFARRVLMVEPTNFFLNEETFQDNKFMNKVSLEHQQSTIQAIEEFQLFKETIQANGVDVVSYKQQTPELPDSVFPNNWFSTHKNEDFPDGLFVLYPMKADTREREKNPTLIKTESQNYKHFLDVQRKDPNQALEGTGSLLFDNLNKKVYVNISIRADEKLLQEFVEEYNKLSAKSQYRSVVWNSVDQNGNPVYHTNVVMAIFENHVVLCTDSIRDSAQKQRVIKEITDPALNNGHARKLIDINYQEMNNMCGNMMMVQNKNGDHCVIMSQRARQGLRPHNLKEIEDNYKIIASDLNMIETIGGGSARCMVAEMF